jgi:calcineurin-like phosphoesterase family protein
VEGKELVNVWFTSDGHIGHRLVSEHRWERQFPGIVAPANTVISWHDQVLAQNWDARVDKDDVVWVAGDISSGTTVGQRHALGWYRKRPGRKRLITGNHDQPHPMHRDAPKWQKIYLEGTAEEPAAFEYVNMSAKIRIALPGEGHTNVFLSHFPYKADRGTVTRHPEWRLPNCGTILLHGHTHSEEVISYDTNVWDPKLTPTPQIHIGLDAWNLSPVSLVDVTKLVWQVMGLTPHEENHDS